MPLTTSVSTSGSTTTIDVDCDSVAKIGAPAFVSPPPGYRNPLASTRERLFTGGTFPHYQQKLVKTGTPYTEFARFRIYNAASTVAANVGQKRMVLGYVDKLIRLNGTLPIAAGSGYRYCPLDTTGTTALQPAIKTTVLGLVSSYLVAAALPASMPTWCKIQPYSFPSSQNLNVGPLEAPYTYWTEPGGGGRSGLMIGGQPYVFPVIGAYSLSDGLPSDALWYVSQAKVAHLAAAPTISPRIDWVDVRGAFISSTTLGPYSLSYVTTDGTFDYYGGAGDLDLSSLLTPPTSARSFNFFPGLSVSAPTTIFPGLADVDNLVACFRTGSLVSLSPSDPTTTGVIGGRAAAWAWSSFDPSGGTQYMPGILFAP